MKGNQEGKEKSMTGNQMKQLIKETCIFYCEKYIYPSRLTVQASHLSPHYPKGLMWTSWKSPLAKSFKDFYRGPFNADFDKPAGLKPGSIQKVI